MPQPSARPVPAASLQDREILSRGRAGDERACREIYEQFHPRLSAFVHRRLTSAARGLLDSEDVVAECLAGALRALPRLRSDDMPRLWAYLRTTASNRIIDAVRAGRSRTPAAGALVRLPEDSNAHPAWEGDLPWLAASARENLAAFEQALTRLVQRRTLGARDGRALRLRLEQGLSYDGIADECGYPTPAAARVSLRRALLRVAGELGREGDWYPQGSRSS